MTRLFRHIARWLTRLLLRAGLLPASTRADTDTMGEWKRLQAEKDDPRPGLVLPDPDAPHAELIRRVRLYAQNGAKALAPLLDEPFPDPSALTDEGVCNYNEEMHIRIKRTLELCEHDEEACMLMRADELGDERSWDHGALRAVHAAYNAPWTVVSGEVYEYETEKRRRVVQ